MLEILILSSVALFFELKQLYAARHFTGASRVVPKLYLVLGLSSGIYRLYILYRVFAGYGLIRAVLCVIVSYVLYYLVTGFINHAIIQRELERTRAYLPFNEAFALANHKCDVAVSKMAFAGLAALPLADVLLYLTT